MKTFFVFCVLVLSCVSANTAEIGISPANGQGYIATGPRFPGSPINVIISLVSPASISIPPSYTANIGIFSSTTFDNTFRVVSTESLALIAGTNQTQWLYTATPTKDGLVNLIIKQGAFGLGLPSADFSFALVLDRKPTVVIPSPGTSAGSLVFTSTITDGLASTETPAFNNSFLNINNGSLASTPVQVGNVNTVSITPFGYGSVTLTASPGYVSDQYGNVNVETISTGTFSPPVGTTFVAPKVVSVNGLSPGNKVYRTGEVISLSVTFDRAVSLAGTAGIPYLRLNSTGSGSPAYAIYTGVSGNSVLFSYTITTGQASSILDVIDTTSLVLASQTALIGTTNLPDFLALTTMPAPGATNSLSKNITYAVNVDAPKPLPQDISGASAPGNCGAGSGIALVLGFMSCFTVTFFRRKPVAGDTSCR